jgi:hypothetical protein
MQSHFHGGAIVAAALVMSSCGDADRSAMDPSPHNDAPAFAIVDGTTTGTPGFYFLPPMVTAPSYSGTFDAFQSPIVDVCVLNGGRNRCTNTIVKSFGGAESDPITVDPVAEVYSATWKKADLGLSTGSKPTYYRLTVKVSGGEAGYADLWVVNTQQDLKSVPAGYVGVVRDRALQIRFRMEADGTTPQRAPLAVADAFTTAAGIALSGNLFDDNGSGADDRGEPPGTIANFTVDAVTYPTGSAPLAGGILQIGADGGLSLTAASVTGLHTFSYTVDNGIAPASTALVSITVTPGAAMKLAFTQQPSHTAAGQPITPAVAVSILDAYDNVVVTATNTVSLSIGTNPAGGALSGSTSVAAVGGVATFSDLRIDKVGAGYTLSAVAAALTGATSSTFDITADGAAGLVITTQPSALAQAGVVFATQPVLQLRDGGGNDVAESGVIVSAAITSGTGTLGGVATATTNASGQATFTGLSIGGTIGTFTLAFTADGVTSATSDMITLNAGAPAAILVSAAATEVLAGGSVQVSGLVTDAWMNLVAGASVAWTSTNGGSFAPAVSTSTNAAGTATVSFTVSATPGTVHTVTGTVNSVFDTTDPITAAGAPAAVTDGPAANSHPGDPFHGAFNSAFTQAAPGVLANDNLGFPSGTVTGFAIGATSSAAGVALSPLPGHATGSLIVHANGSVNFTPPADFTGLYSFEYTLANSHGSSTAAATVAVGVRSTASSSAYPHTLVGNVPINTAGGTPFTVSFTGDAVALEAGTATNGAVSLNADGTFTFTPDAGFRSGNASFQFTTSNGFGTTAPATVTIPVGASAMWFVSGAAASGDGRLATPFHCVVGASGCLNSAARAAGDVTFVHSGTYGSTAALVLLGNERVIGAGAVGTLATLSGLTFPAHSTALLPATGAAKPTLNSAGGNAITLASGNTLRGFIAGGAPGAAIAGAAVGTLTVADVDINNATGRALDLTTSGTLAAAFGSISATGGTGNGINLVNQAGTLTSGSTTITNPSGTGIHVQGSAGFAFGATTVGKSAAGTGVNLNTNLGTTTFSSLTVTTAAGTALLAASAGTVSVNGGALSATGGPAIEATGTAFGGTGFTSTSSSGSSGRGVALTNVTGTLALGAGSIGTAAAEAFFVSGGTAALSYGGNITNAANRAVSVTGRTGGNVTLSGNITETGTGLLVQNNTGGTVTFSGATKSFTTGASAAVSLANNTGATINLSGGGLAVSTTSGGGFSATGGGTVQVTGANNTVSSGTGTALSVQNTSIGGSGLTFRSVSHGGGANGIVLVNTGTEGGLQVTGNGTTHGSGGTIVNTTGADGAVAGNGIYLSGTRNVSLSWMNLSGHTNHAIRGEGVTNFAMDRVRITGANGNNVAHREGSVSFDNLYGSSSITRSYIAGGAEDNVRVHNGFPVAAAASLNRLTLSNDTIGHNGTSGNAGVNVAGFGTAVMNVTVQNSRFTGSRNNNIAYVINENASGDVVVENNVLTNNHPNKLGSDFGIYVAHASNGAVTYQVSGNTVNGAGGSGIEVDRGAGGTGTMTGSITGNTVGTSGVANSGSSAASGIFVAIVGTGSTATHTTTVSNNTVRQFTNFGIYLYNSGTGNNYLNATVQNNNIAEPSPNSVSQGFPTSGFRILNGTASGHDGRLCLALSGNTVTQTATSISHEVRVWGRFASRTAIPGLTGDVDAFLSNQNTITSAAGSLGAVNASSTNPFQSACPPT